MRVNWQAQAVAAGVIAALGLYILANPVGVTMLAAGIIPWLLVGAGAIYLLGTFLRSRRRPITMILPGVVGVLLVYSGLSLKLGDPTRVGPVGLAFLFALLLVGSGVAKLLMMPGLTKSRYKMFLLGSGAVSLAMGLVVMFAWSSVSAGFVGAVLGLELIADAVFLGSLALRERDREEAKEALGMDPGS
jgi:uncharacterized membrane protein HdeD (DUF308 family)